MNGTYNDVHITSAELVELGKMEPKKPAIAIDCTLPDGSRVDGVLWLTTDKAIARTIESLRHAGWQGTDLGDLAGVGSELVQIVVEEEEFGGDVTSRVKWVNANNSNRFGKLAPDARSALAARMNAAAGLEQPKPATRRAPPRQAQVTTKEPPPADDDIPF